MSVIRLLPPELVSKIAAGEVIERPAFVVKELVENAFDAGATDITVEVTKGGLESIVVRDNGEGMTAEDLFLSWQRHTTSKLAPDSDLTVIEKLGFRGEALSSIAAVSDLQIQSRRPDEPGGNSIHIRNGKFLESAAVGMAPGTIARVQSIFHGLPGRQKFLASAQTEWQHILRVLEGQALSHPEVRFTVKHNGRFILEVQRESVEDRLAHVLGNDVAMQSFPFALEDPYATIAGFIGTPQLSFHTNVPSHLIVNNRVVKNKALAHALKESYKGFLKVEATPFFLLYITVPVQTIDVNIHPRKEEIKFLNEKALSAALREEVRAVARQQNLSYRWSTPEGDTASHAAKELRSRVVANMKELPKDAPVLQIHNLYLATQTDEGFVLIDQHAAHERVLYDQLLESYVSMKEQQTVFRLKEPKELTLPLSQSAILEAQLEHLHKLGFELEQTSPTTFRISAVPELFQDRNFSQLFQEILSDFEDGDAVASVDKHTNRMIAFLACRMAVKAGDPLSEEQRRQLVREIGGTHTSFTCPHGRPTHVVFSLSELEVLFGRK